MTSHVMESDQQKTSEAMGAAEWITGLASRFPTQASVERLRALLTKISTASIYDPGETDLDDEQPISLTVDLGDVRMARRLLR